MVMTQIYVNVAVSVEVALITRRNPSLALLIIVQLIVSHLYVNLVAETVSTFPSLIILLALMVIPVQAVTCVKRVNASVNLLSAHQSRTNVDILSVS